MKETAISRWQKKNKAHLSEYKKRYRLIKPEILKNIDLKKRYKIGLKEYNELLVKQENKCAICGTLKAGNRQKYFCVDHNHETGEIRGLLCSTCNRAIGLFKDDKKILEKAIIYLDFYERYDFQEKK
jgi:Recombination endonuclease VII